MKKLLERKHRTTTRGLFLFLSNRDWVQEFSILILVQPVSNSDVVRRLRKERQVENLISLPLV